MHDENEILEYDDILANIFSFFSQKDHNAARLVCKQWHKVSCLVRYKSYLMDNFNIPLEIINSLKSVQCVAIRLQRLLNNKDYFQKENVYKLYCSTDSIYPDFLHLLDNDEQWFENYFAHSDTYFLEINFRLACVVGNFELLRFLMEKKGCILKKGCVLSENKNIQAAISSGELILVKFLFEQHKVQDLFPALDYEYVISEYFNSAIRSGSLEMLNYIKTLYPNRFVANNYHMLMAVESNSLQMVIFLHTNYQLSSKDILPSVLAKTANMELIKYVVEEMDWGKEETSHIKELMSIGNRTLNEIIVPYFYEFGNKDIVDYIQRQFPCQIDINEKIRLSLITGDLRLFISLLESINVKPSDLINQNINQQVYLSNALYSCNLNLVKYLFEIFMIKQIHPEYNCYLILNNINLVKHFLAFNYQVKLQNICNNIWLVHNLESFLLLIDSCADLKQVKDADVFGDLIDLKILYHLIKIKGFIPTQNTLKRVFGGYLGNGQYDMDLHFIKFLLTDYHLRPTQDMIDKLEKRNDKHLLPFLHEIISSDSEDNCHTSFSK